MELDIALILAIFLQSTLEVFFFFQGLSFASQRVCLTLLMLFSKCLQNQSPVFTSVPQPAVPPQAQKGPV